MAGAEHRGALEMRMAVELVAHVPVQPQVVEEVVALEDAVMRHRPVIGLRHIGPHDGGAELGMAGCGQDVADVVDQGADDVFLVHAVAVGEAGGLQRVLQPVDGETAAIALEHSQMRQNPVRQVLVERHRGGGDLHPVGLGSVGHRGELGAVGRVLGHRRCPFGKPAAVSAGRVPASTGEVGEG